MNTVAEQLFLTHRKSTNTNVVISVGFTNHELHRSEATVDQSLSSDTELFYANQHQPRAISFHHWSVSMLYWRRVTNCDLLGRLMIMLLMPVATDYTLYVDILYNF